MCERKTSNLSSCVQGVREILMFFHNGKNFTGHISHTFQEASHTSLWYISSQIMLTFLVKFMHHKSHKNPLPSSLPSVMKEFLGNSSRS